MSDEGRIKPITRRIKNFKVGDTKLIVEEYPKSKHDLSDIYVLRLTVKSFDENTGCEKARSST